MKKFLPILSAALLFALVPVGAGAQVKSAYFMEGSVQRLDMNASFVPLRGYVNIPFIGSIGVDVNSNFLSVRNFLYPSPDGSGVVTFMHESVDARDFLHRMRRNNHVDVSLRENLLGFGSFTRRYFWSFNLNLRSESSLTVPKEFFELLKRPGNGTYDMDRFRFESDNWLEFAFGAAFPVEILDHRVEVGARVKGLVGLAQVRADVTRLDVCTGEEEWRADFSGDISANVMFMDYSTRYGRMPLSDALDGDFGPGGGRGGWGLAFDLGASTRFLDDRLRVSVGLNDLGFIRWSSSGALRIAVEEQSVSFRGYDFDVDDFDYDTPDDVMAVVSEPAALSRMLNATLNLGAEYNILEDRIGFGLLSQIRFCGTHTSSELTLSANFRPLHWFSGTLSHSIVQNRMGIFGLALNFHPSWINFFLGADYVGLRWTRGVPLPVGMKAANFYFGLAVPISRPKEGGCFPDRTRH